MIDLKKQKWDFDRKEKYAIKWLSDHGFSVTLKSQYVSVTHYTVSKNGVTDNFDFPAGDENLNCKKYMEQFGRNFELLCELIELRKKVK